MMDPALSGIGKEEASGKRLRKVIIMINDIFQKVVRAILNLITFSTVSKLPPVSVETIRHGSLSRNLTCYRIFT